MSQLATTLQTTLAGAVAQDLPDIELRKVILSIVDDDKVELTTPDGEPITNASISVEAFANARRDDVLTAGLAETETGHKTTLPMRRNGLWAFRFTVTRDDELFTYRDTRHIWTEIPE